MMNEWPTTIFGPFYAVVVISKTAFSIPQASSSHFLGVFTVSMNLTQTYPGYLSRVNVNYAIILLL